MTPTESDEQLDEILDLYDRYVVEDGDNPINHPYNNRQRAKAALQVWGQKQRIEELRLTNVGRVTSKNKNNLTYMSGFGYAANKLQEHKNARLNKLMTEQDKLLAFVQDPETIKRAVEGSMDKRSAVLCGYASVQPSGKHCIPKGKDRCVVCRLII